MVDLNTTTAAKLAYRRAKEDGQSDETRAVASQNPLYAYLYATGVDHGPHDVTRQGACLQAHYAFHYAFNVDHGPHPATRQAMYGADGSLEWAADYARLIDRYPSADWPARVSKALPTNPVEYIPQPAIRESAAALVSHLVEGQALSSVQAILPTWLALRVRSIGEALKSDDLGPDGVETDVHLTVKYGLLAPAPMPELLKILARTAPFDCRLGDLAVFGGSQDVLHLQVESQELRRLNARISTLPHHDTFPNYNPHVTVGYLLKGRAVELIGPCALTGQTWLVDKVEFSSWDGRKVVLPLRG